MSSVYTKTDTRLNILQCQDYTTDTTIAAEQASQKLESQMKILAPEKAD